MSKINDGGPAYPFILHPGFEWAENGVSKRELAAFMAMQGMLSSEVDPEITPYSPVDCSERAVQFADALLAALAKNGPAPSDIATGEIGGRE